MNTFQLSCFLAVAEYLNFAQAAQSLHVTHRLSASRSNRWRKN